MEVPSSIPEPGPREDEQPNDPDPRTTFALGRWRSRATRRPLRMEDQMKRAHAHEGALRLVAVLLLGVAVIAISGYVGVLVGRLE